MPKKWFDNKPGILLNEGYSRRVPRSTNFEHYLMIGFTLTRWIHCLHCFYSLLTLLMTLILLTLLTLLGKGLRVTRILLDWSYIIHHPCCCCLLEYPWCGQKRSLWTMLQTWLEIGISSSDLWLVSGHFKDGRAGISASKNLDDNVDPISPVGFLVQDLKGLQNIFGGYQVKSRKCIIYRLVTFDEYKYDHKGSTKKSW